MCWILFLLSAVAFVTGVGALLTATTVFQEILGLIAFVIWAILFSGAAIIEAVANLKQKLRKITAPTEELARLKEKILSSSGHQDLERKL